MRESTEEKVRKEVEKFINPSIESLLKKALVGAIVHYLWEQFEEADPIKNALPEELFCPWDGRMHRAPECDAAVVDYLITDGIKEV